MLTKTDLSKIDKIVKTRVREEVEAEGRNIRDELGSDVRTSRMRIQEDVREVSTRIKNLEIRAGKSEKLSLTIKKDVNLLMKDFRRIEKKIDKSVDFIDREYLALKKRVEKLEEHLNIDSPSL